MQANSPIMRDICAHNYIELNEDDAVELGITDGDSVVVTGVDGSIMEGPAMVRGGVARGVFGIAYGYGHRQMGARDLDIDGEITAGNTDISAGVHLQQMKDPTMDEDVLYFLTDPLSSVPGRNGGMFRIEKA
jgi:tetrathionate reductase subunit A